MPFVETKFNIKDEKIKIHIGVFYNRVEQLDVGGGSACSILVVTIIDWLYKNPSSLPIKLN